MGFNPTKTGDVWPIEHEDFKFFVRSDSEPNFPRTVDLDCYKWNGECDCEDFKFRCAPELSKGAEPGESLQCKHLRKAWRYYITKIILPNLRGALEAQRNPVSPELQAQAIITAIAQKFEPGTLESLKRIKEHLELSMEQVLHEIDSVRDTEKYEDAPAVDEDRIPI